MRSWAILLICALLGACASAPPAPLAKELLADSTFGPPSEPIAAADVFAVMSRYATEPYRG